MKVVLFCGGQGMRLRDYSEDIPKPMVPVGRRPILLHLMKYFAHFGHDEFILCLGHKAEVIKDYFLNYSEALSNDFVLSQGGRSVELLSRDIDNWKISFIDTGINTSIGERLKTVQYLLKEEEMFLANYSDGLTDLWLPDYLDHFQQSGKIASFLAVQSTQSFHVAQLGVDGTVFKIEPLSESDQWINGGFFAFRTQIFDHLGVGDDLVSDAFARLIAQRELIAYRHRGFWMAMDTFKDKQALDALHEKGGPPWEIWRRSATEAEL